MNTPSTNTSDLKTLLQILLEYIEQNKISGICIASISIQFKGIITRQEKLQIDEFLNPILKPYIALRSDGYAFPPYEKAPRIKLLTELIEKL